MKLKLIAMTAIAVVGLSSCHEHSHGEHDADHDHDHHHESEEAAHAGQSSDEISFSEDKQKTFNIITDSVRVIPFASVIHVGGQMLPAQGDEFVLVAPSSGVVSFKTTLSQGSFLQEGSVVAQISSEAIAGGDQVARAKASYETALSQYERATQLSSEGLISKTEYEQAHLAYVQAKSEYEALGSVSQGSGVPVKVGSKGYVRSLEVVSGQYVQAGQPIVTLSRGRSLILQAEVPERYASTLGTVLDANFSVPSGEIYSVRELGGRVLSRARNAVDGYFTVTLEVPDRGTLVSGAYAEVWLKSAKSSAECIVIPTSALIEEQGIYSVFVQLDEDCFRKREVKLGESDGRRVQVVSGLEVGETIVTGGTMHIKLASVASVPAGHNHNH